MVGQARSRLLLAALLVTACGSRSGLSGGEGAASDSTASSGTTTGTTTAGGGGSGGTGGVGGAGGVAGAVQIECGELHVVGPPAYLENGFGMHERSPRWTLSSDDGARVTLVASQQAAEGPSGSDFPVQVTHTTLSPWEAFPAGGLLGPKDFAASQGGESFAAARSPGDRFALLFREVQSPNGGLLFSNAVVPFQSDFPFTKLVNALAKEALFAAQGPGGHLLGMLTAGASGGGSSYLLGAEVAADNGGLTELASLGCASGPMYADAVSAPGGWLVALSNGGSLGGADCLDPGLSWPDVVQIVRTDGFEYDQTDDLGAPGGATDVKVAGRSDGAWVVLGTPPGQVVSGMFLAARVDQAGKVVSTFAVAGGDPFQEIPQNGTLAVASVSDWLAAAWIDYGGDKGPFLHVKVFSPEGVPGGHAEIFPGTSFSGAPSLLGSPVTPSLVLAWSETPDQGMGDGDKMRAVRLDCVTSP